MLYQAELSGGNLFGSRCCLPFFECQCRGVKLYRLKDAKLEYWTSAPFEREPENEHDCFCVAVRVPRVVVGGQVGC